MTHSISSPISLGTKLVQAVQKEAAMQRPLPLSAVVHDELPKCERLDATVILIDNDRLSHLAQQITVSVQQNPSQSTLKAAKPVSVQQKAERFAARATYLTEALQFVESDAQGAAILRSTPQTMRARRAEYFEAHLTDSSLTLQRYKPHDDKPGREAVPFCVTDDVLSRLADDAVQTLLNRK
jgi:hypothetical protein